MEPAQEVREEWARRKQRIVSRHDRGIVEVDCTCDVASTARGDQPCPDRFCPTHGEGIKGGQGRDALDVVVSARNVGFVVGLVVATFAMVAVYFTAKAAGWL